MRDSFFTLPPATPATTPPANDNGPAGPTTPDASNTPETPHGLAYGPGEPFPDAGDLADDFSDAGDFADFDF